MRVWLSLVACLGAAAAGCAVRGPEGGVEAHPHLGGARATTVRPINHGARGPAVEIARSELARLAGEHSPLRAAVVIMEVGTGRILASVGHGSRGDAEALRAVPTGSTVKPLTVAAALEG